MSIDDISVEMIILLIQIGLISILSLIGRMKNRGSRGYHGKGYITMNIQGKQVKIPVTQLKIIPPKGGTAAVWERERSVI
jgi:hypothetical protein